MSKRAAMRQLCGDLTADLEVTRPAPPEAIFTALCDHLSEKRGRPVEHRLVHFPQGLASGLWLNMEDRDLIVVEQQTGPLHQLVIFGHEVWHMTAGHCGSHTSGLNAAARLLGDETDVAAAVRSVAARTDFDRAEEEDAERFGQQLGTTLRSLLEPDKAPVSALERRIQASLGRRPG
ncbi:toxin-antitoxin system, toxin component [Streptomyces boluensis]|uniref:Toxin-antitoxin system, toxin component n=1 Tax=Streptomyces boluensis TaxID=1775135 RepID=A0A964XP92_9ACTN|nr:toxin-antitoxin system, toxin component [Streptomyces boluensis]NBE54383.1 toxin-antitoxin system, toxin component [Streptomyces boluensis]